MGFAAGLLLIGISLAACSSPSGTKAAQGKGVGVLVASTTTRPATSVPPCAPSALSIAVRFVQGTAENWLIPVTFTNVSATNCSVFGYPTLSLVNEAGQTVGMPVKDSQDGEPLRSITLEPRESAWASLWQPNTTDMVSASQPCSPVPWTSIRVVSPGAAVVTGSSGDWSKATTTCSTGVATTIGPLVPNAGLSSLAS